MTTWVIVQQEVSISCKATLVAAENQPAIPCDYNNQKRKLQYCSCPNMEIDNYLCNSQLKKRAGRTAQDHRW